MTCVIKDNVNVYGYSAQPMIFAHGCGCDRNMWRLVASVVVGEYCQLHLRTRQRVIMNATVHCQHLRAPDRTHAASKAFLAGQSAS